MWSCYTIYASGDGFRSLSTQNIVSFLSLILVCSLQCELSAAVLATRPSLQHHELYISRIIHPKEVFLLSDAVVMVFSHNRKVTNTGA